MNRLLKNSLALMLFATLSCSLALAEDAKPGETDVAKLYVTAGKTVKGDSAVPQTPGVKTVEQIKAQAAKTQTQAQKQDTPKKDEPKKSEPAKPQPQAQQGQKPTQQQQPQAQQGQKPAQQQQQPQAQQGQKPAQQQQQPQAQQGQTAQQQQQPQAQQGQTAQQQQPQAQQGQKPAQQQQQPQAQQGQTAQQQQQSQAQQGQKPAQQQPEQTQNQQQQQTQQQQEQQAQQQQQVPAKPKSKYGPNWNVGDSWVIQATSQQGQDSTKTQKSSVLKWRFTVVKLASINKRPAYQVKVERDIIAPGQPVVYIWVDVETGALVRTTEYTWKNGSWVEHTEFYSAKDGKAAGVLGSIPLLPLDMPIFTAQQEDGDSKALGESDDLTFDYSASYSKYAGQDDAKALGQVGVVGGGMFYTVKESVRPLSPEMAQLLGAQEVDSKAIGVPNALQDAVEVHLTDSANADVKQVWIPNSPWPVYSDNGTTQAVLLESNLQE